ncbi:MAG TPA: hypothetical protein PKM21_09585 [Anaerolineales bacterium]|mgnify:CR=1 FL=1|nr:hypothetical protein [Anaerolineales bacterium]
MSKFYAILGALIVGFVVVLSLLTALTSASASLANGAANLASSTALLTGQCLTAFLVVVSLAAGIVLGLGVGALRGKSLPAPSARHRWMPGPNAHWQKINVPIRAQLPPPQPQSLPKQQILLAADVEEEDDLPLQGWGF